MKQFKNEYQQIVDAHSPKNKVWANSMKAFLVGGIICTLGQGLVYLYMYWGLSFDESSMLSTITLILASMVCTAFNVYDNIGKFGGAGALIPITGFANSMVSSAMEYKKEGYIYGLGAKLFSIAGPVIVFGTIASVVVGIIYYFV
ncbi:stage V sporulation protein AC [Sporanaerobium hydrogeniformans]|uniref:Stage V sporulation protein AC n=2 Tax=Sporanaerobium hydrogeniformans TaxID=3072179 RepID=A0AC61DGU3_9FIRM|nr:stage V sporulation protein AC [Sporanaerobium hydrogeniformans]